MTTHQTEVLVRSSTDAEFRAWVTALSNALVAVGLVQTADTGQINKATVLMPSAANQSRGYEIFRFNDALQATKPVFIKVEYGSGGNVLYTGTWYTVGSGTDGAGNITGLVSTRQQVTVGVTSSAPSPLLAFGDGSSLGLALTYATLGNPYIWTGAVFIERSRDVDGTPNGDGFWMSTSSASAGGSLTQFFSFTNNTQSAVQSNFTTPFPSRFSSANAGTSMTLFPAIVVTPKAQAPALLLLSCGINDYVRGTLVSVFIAGAVHTYYAITGTNPGRSLEGNACGFLMRWE